MLISQAEKDAADEFLKSASPGHRQAIAKAISDKVCEQVEPMDPTGRLRKSIRNAMQTTVLNFEQEKMRWELELRHILTDETARLNAELGKMQGGREIAKAGVGLEPSVRVTTGDGSQSPINLELHLHQPLSPVINMPEQTQQRKIVRHLDEDTVEITSGDDYDSSRMKQQLPKGK